MTLELKNKNNKTSNMKNKILYIALSAIIVSCSAPDKKAELEKLKKQKTELETKITLLEEDLAKSDTAKNKEKTIEVVAIPIQPEIFKTYIEVQGRIDADENVSLSTQMPGTITQINVKVGDHVTKGQELALTETRAIQQQMSDLQTNLDLAKQVYDRQKNLWDQKIGTEVQYLQAKANKESLERKIGNVQEQLRMSKIISPINGTVDAVNIKLGQMVAPGLSAINVINFSNLKVKADVAESYATRVKTGNEVRVLFPDAKDSITSKVSYASRAISSLSRTFNVEVMLDNSKEYHPNMVAKLRINDFQSPTPEIIIPVKYIQRGTSENYVLVAQNNKAIKKVIKTNREYNGMIEVTSGLNAGDLLIIAGYDMLNDGDAITVKK
jgi:membrane fusion protein, multidrug efflux system